MILLPWALHLPIKVLFSDRDVTFKPPLANKTNQTVERTTKFTKSNHQPTTTMLTNHVPQCRGKAEVFWHQGGSKVQAGPCKCLFLCRTRPEPKGGRNIAEEMP